tara:strand:- start:130 stop:1164 length:1035 start_codon:yes stop_codon:yes gene_type:complete
MFITSRYIFGRITKPKDIRILSDGSLSHARNQDTTAKIYTEACARHEIEPAPNTLKHLIERDKHAWMYTSEYPISGHDIDYAIEEATEIVSKMRKQLPPGPRNSEHCFMCDWKMFCQNDPAGEILEWIGVTNRDNYSGTQDVFKVTGYSRDLSRNSTFITSPSGMAAYLQCPRKWLFSYKYKKSPEKTAWESVSPRMLGTLAHAGAETIALFWKGMINQQMLEERREEAIINTAGELGSELLPHLKEHAPHAFKVGEQMFNEATKDLKEILHIEQRFIFRLPHCYSWVTCQPDLVGKDTHGNLVVVDYKTTGHQALASKASNFLNRRAMALYAHSVIHGKLVEE